MRNIHILRLNAEAHTANFVYIRIANAKSDHRQLKKHLRNYIVWVEECIGQCHWSMFKYQMPGTYCAHIPFKFFFPEKKVLDKYVGRVEWRFLVPRNAPVFGEHSTETSKSIVEDEKLSQKKNVHFVLLALAAVVDASAASGLIALTVIYSVLFHSGLFVHCLSLHVNDFGVSLSQPSLYVEMHFICTTTIQN